MLLIPRVSILLSQDNFCSGTTWRNLHCTTMRGTHSSPCSCGILCMQAGMEAANHRLGPTRASARSRSRRDARSAARARCASASRRALGMRSSRASSAFLAAAAAAVAPSARARAASSAYATPATSL